MLKQMPIVLLAIIISVVMINPFLPLGLQKIMYSISISIKSLIIFILPLIIFGLLFQVISNLASKATTVVLIIFFAVIISNFISTLLSQYIGMSIYQLDLSVVLPKNTLTLNEYNWALNLSPIISNDKAIIFAILSGLVLGRFAPNALPSILSFIKLYISYILKSFTYLVPIFIIGFVIKMEYDQVIYIFAKEYISIFLIIICSQFIYIGLLYYLANNCRMNRTIISISNLFPAWLSGFSTMSSAATMPITIFGVEKNVINKNFAKSIISSTVNIHLIGDCFAIPILAYAIMKNFDIEAPSLPMYMTFAIYFVIAKFSVAAVPGGGIIVMLPILEKYLGFTKEMLSLITALYILFDPMITSANILGNGAFAQILDKLFIKIGLIKK
ncbi:MAG: cation:dicarboxylase symporter family transporter [Rickettsiaceae bacterium]